MDTTIVSCPGKVLIAGGYLVLDPAYSGLVVGTSSRVYTVVQSLSKPSKHSSIVFVARSPQFLKAEWTYQAELAESAEANVVLTQLTAQTRAENSNKFVELAIRESLRLSIALQPDHLLIHKAAERQATGAALEPCTLVVNILADNDFYSQPRTCNTPSPPFNRLDTDLANVHKTGLGSSAAMVTSLCSAVLLHLVPSLDRHSPACKFLVHNLSQYVHSLAQGKVGSGFDVSAAVWGTHAYRRFSECCFKDLLGQDEPKITAKLLHDILDPSVNHAWKDPATASSVEGFSLPTHTTLLMADVDGGSHTPSMVGKVLAWKKGNQDFASKMWNAIASLNNRLRDIFVCLNEIAIQEPSNYTSQIVELVREGIPLDCYSVDSSRDGKDTRSLLLEVSSIMKECRKMMKNMGEQAAVPIEPQTQTKLLDACEKIPGVLGCGVPGAGGYDAIWVLILHPHQTGTAVEKLLKLWNSWTEVSVKALSSDAWVTGGVSSRQNNGIRIMGSVEEIEGLEEALTAERDGRFG